MVKIQCKYSLINLQKMQKFNINQYFKSELRAHRRLVRMFFFIHMISSALNRVHDRFQRRFDRSNSVQQVSYVSIIEKKTVPKTTSLIQIVVANDLKPH